MTPPAKNEKSRAGLKDVVFLGCGNMGGALAATWLKTFPDIRFHIIKPTPLPDDLNAFPNVHYFPDIITARKVIETADLIILAIKPQMMQEICSELNDHLPSQKALLSIAAGTKIETIQDLFEHEMPVIRVMPNTPVSIQKGMSAGCFNDVVTDQQAGWAKTLFDETGHFVWIENEELMDSVTALSGSGPAYVFHFIEMLAQAGQEIGFDRQTSMVFARQMVIGAAALAEKEAGISAEQLRKNVTSPGGTTQAGLDVLMDGRAQSIINEVLKAAKERGKELNKKS